MAERTVVRLRAPIGGVSTQPPEARSSAQVERAENVDVTAAKAYSRTGSVHLAAFAGLTVPSNATYEAVQTSDGDSFRVLVAQNTLEVITEQHVRAFVHKLDIASYLAATADRFPVVALNDVALVASSGVVPKAKATPARVVAKTVVDERTMRTWTALPGQVYSCENQAATGGLGLWEYRPGAGTFATIRCATYTASTNPANPTQSLNDSGGNPVGFRLQAARHLHTANGSTYTDTAFGSPLRRVTLSVALSGYTFEPGDMLLVVANNTDAFPAGANSYRIKVVESSTQLILEESIITSASVAATTVDVRGIGREGKCLVDFYRDPVDRMEDAALKIQESLRNGGLPDVCVAWQPTGTGTLTGNLILTSPWGGPRAGWFTNCSRDAAAADTAIGHAVAFSNGIAKTNSSPTIVAGTGAGAPFRVDPVDRWLPLGVSDQADGQLDENTWPFQIKKVPTSTWANNTAAFRPLAYWKLDEANGSGQFVDEQRVAHGSIGANATPGTGSMRDGTGFTFANVSGHTFTSQMPTLGTTKPLTFEAWIKTTSGSLQTIFAWEIGVHTNGNTIRVTWNTSTGDTSTIANLTDGNLKHIAVTVTPGSSSVTVWVNGTAYAVGLTSGVGPSTNNVYWRGLTTASLGSDGDGVTRFVGTIDEAAVYAHAWTTETASWRYRIATNPGSTEPGYVAAPVLWAPRRAGDSVSNPIPGIIKRGNPIRAMAVQEARLVVAGGPDIAWSRARNGVQFFADDPAVPTDADPIDRQIGASTSAQIRWLVPFRRAMLITTNTDDQYEAAFRDGLSAGSLNIARSTSLPILDTKPVTIDNRIYMLSSVPGGAELVEYTLDDEAISGTVERLGQSTPGLIDSQNLLMASGPEAQVVWVLERSTGRRWTYRVAFAAGERRQSAFTTADMGGATLGVVRVGQSIDRLMTRTGSSTPLLERTLTTEDVADAGWAFPVRLDGRMSLTGSHSAGTTTWTIPTGVPVTGITHAVKPDGTILALSAGSGVVTAAGIHDAAPVSIGRAYTSTITLGRVFARDQDDRAVLGINLSYRIVHVTLHKTGTCTLQWQVFSRTAETKTLASTSTLVTTVAQAFVNGDSDNCTLSLVATGPRPIGVGAIEVDVDAVGERVG
jgi:hypothetical protein